VGKYSILGASPKGNDETILQVRSDEVGPPVSLAWSPRADEIAYSNRDLGEGGIGMIDVLNVGTGKSHRLVTFKDKAAVEIYWSPDGRTLFAKYMQSVANVAGQIGFLRGAERTLSQSRGTQTCTTLTLSADAKNPSDSSGEKLCDHFRPLEGRASSRRLERSRKQAVQLVERPALWRFLISNRIAGVLNTG
jgi:hypothetical protein